MLYVSPETRQVLRKIQAQHTASERVRSSIRVRQPARMLSEERFTSLAAGIAIVLGTGTSSLFQFEGACRHGLRRVLILQDWSWRDADMAAAAVVSVALMQVGAERPTWNEGQPDYLRNLSVDRHYCERCGGHLEEGRFKYCSKLCSNAAGKERAAKFDTQVSLAEYQATIAERRLQKIKDCSKKCDACRKPFIASRPSTRFCSIKCGASERVKNQPRPCKGCGAPALPKNGEAKSYCSKACYDNNRRLAVAELKCGYCLSIFRSKRPKTFCSVSCAAFGRKSSRSISKFQCEEVR